MQGAAQVKLNRAATSSKPSCVRPTRQSLIRRAERDTPRKDIHSRRPTRAFLSGNVKRMMKQLGTHVLKDQDFVTLLRDFTCPTCRKLLQEPLQFEGCGHAFCRACILDQLEGPGITKSECPVCHQPAWKKDLKPNQQYGSIACLLQSHMPSEGEVAAADTGAEMSIEGALEDTRRLPLRRPCRKRGHNRSRVKLQVSRKRGKANSSVCSRKGGRQRNVTATDDCNDAEAADSPKADSHTKSLVHSARSRPLQGSSLENGLFSLLGASRSSSMPFPGVPFTEGKENSEKDSSLAKQMSLPSPARPSPPSAARYEVIPDTPEQSAAILASQTPDMTLSEEMSKEEAASEALDVHMLLAEICKIEELLDKSELGASQLDAMMQNLGTEYVLNAGCRTQRRLGDIDFELLTR